MTNFHLLEVVGRGSETQLQVGENLKKITCKGGQVPQNYVNASGPFLNTTGQTCFTQWSIL